MKKKRPLNKSSTKNLKKVSKSASTLGGARVFLVSAFCQLLILSVVLLSMLSPLNEFSQKQKLATKLEPLTFKIYNFSRTSQGTAFFVKAKSGQIYTLTNKHVCNRDSTGLTFYNTKLSRFVTLNIVEKSIESDLCLLTAPTGVENYLEMAASVSSGQVIYTYGFPQGFDEYFSIGTYLFETWAAAAEEMEACAENSHFTGQYQIRVDSETQEEICVFVMRSVSTTIPSNKGASGSPIVNIEGKLVSVLWGINQPGNFGQGVAFNDLENFLAAH